MLISALAITFGASQVANAEGGTNDLAPVDVVEVNGLIDEIVVRDIEQAIERAEASTSQAVILQVNSLGGVVSRTRMEALFNKIIDSKRGFLPRKNRCFQTRNVVCLSRRKRINFAFT